MPDMTERGIPSVLIRLACFSAPFDFLDRLLADGIRRIEAILTLQVRRLFGSGALSAERQQIRTICASTARKLRTPIKLVGILL